MKKNKIYQILHNIYNEHSIGDSFSNKLQLYTFKKNLKLFSVGWFIDNIKFMINDAISKAHMILIRKLFMELLNYDIKKHKDPFPPVFMLTQKKVRDVIDKVFISSYKIDDKVTEIIEIALKEAFESIGYNSKGIYYRSSKSFKNNIQFFYSIGLNAKNKPTLSLNLKPFGWEGKIEELRSILSKFITEISQNYKKMIIHYRNLYIKLRFESLQNKRKKLKKELTTTAEPYDIIIKKIQEELRKIYNSSKNLKKIFPVKSIYKEIENIEEIKFIPTDETITRIIYSTRYKKELKSLEEDYNKYPYREYGRELSKSLKRKIHPPFNKLANRILLNLLNK